MGQRQKSDGSRALPESRLPDDLYDYARLVRPRRAQPIKATEPSHKVRDDWPEDVPVTLAEVEVFEAWFGELLDELFGPL